MAEKLAMEELTQKVSMEGASENILRPKKLADYVGQEEIKSRLEVFIKAAKKRKSSLDHVILAGPPGLGKTTMAHIIASEMGGHLHSVPGPSLERSVDLISILSNLQEGDVLFIDEIHRLQPIIEETLYPAMEDRMIQVVIGEGAAAQTVTMPLQPFTLIGATTQAGKLTGPLRDRFGIPLSLDFYNVTEIEKILKRSAKILDVELGSKQINAIAKRSRGTPRIANRLLARVRDFLDVFEDDTTGMSAKTQKIFAEINAQKDNQVFAVDKALDFLSVDKNGLQSIDRRYLAVLAEQFKGGPAGIEAIAATMSEDRRTLEEMIEPYLLKEGVILRTLRGRQLSQKGIQLMEDLEVKLEFSLNI